VLAARRVQHGSTGGRHMCLQIQRHRRLLGSAVLRRLCVRLLRRDLRVQLPTRHRQQCVFFTWSLLVWRAGKRPVRVLPVRRHGLLDEHSVRSVFRWVVWPLVHAPMPGTAKQPLQRPWYLQRWSRGVRDMHLLAIARRQRLQTAMPCHTKWCCLRPRNVRSTRRRCRVPMQHRRRG
jgi:hypothetical protein